MIIRVERRKRSYLFLIPILLLAFGLRLYHLDAQSLWWDELKTVQRASMSWAALLTDLAGHRAHLPLYFGLMRGWGILGNSAFAVRLFSVVWGVLGVAGIFQLGRRLTSTSVGLTAAFLLAISPFHIWYSQEARMYSFLPSVLIFSHISLLKASEETKWTNWLSYALLTSIAVYTHYFALFVVMAHYVFLVLHLRQLRPQTARWFKMLVLVGLSLLPWALFIATGGSSGDPIATVPGWINKINWYDPLLTIWTFSVGPGFGIAQWPGFLCLGLFLLGLLTVASYLPNPKAKHTGERPFASNTLKARMLFLWLLLPIGIPYLISLDYPFWQQNRFSLYLDRYLILALPPFLLLVAWGINRLAQTWKRPILTPLFLLVALATSSYSLWQQTHNPIHFRNDWHGAMALIETSQPKTAVILGQQDIILPLAYYGQNQVALIQIPPPQGNAVTPDFATAMATQIDTAVQQSSYVWHIEPFYNHDTHQFPEARTEQLLNETLSVPQTWLKSHYPAIAQHQLPGIRLTLFDISSAISP